MTTSDVQTTRPAAMVAGTPVSDAEVKAYANELAGGVVLEEIALDRLVKQRCQALGVTVTQAETDAERQMVLESMARGGETSADNALAILDRVQKQRGLGPRRFNALLERNALMRKLVAPSVTVGEDQVDQAMTVRYGERRNARIIVRNSQQEASQSLSRLQGQAGAALSAAFADEAARNSVDQSAARGGILEPISVADPAYPAIVRQTLANLSVGQLSTIVALDRGFAVVLLESVTPATSPPADGRVKAREEVTRRAQRVAMDRLARDLLTAAGVTVFDESLRWSWENRAQAGRN